MSTTSNRWVVGALGVAAVAVLATLVVVADGDKTAAPTTTTVASTSTSTSVAPSTTTVPSTDTTAIWPSAGVGPSDPVVATRQFASAFLGFTDPIVGEYRAGDARSGEVEVRPTATGPATTVLVRMLTGADTWSVLGATTADIEVTAPEAGAPITSPVRVAGRALAFEGNVNVEVREDGRTAAIGSGFVTGGGDQLRPFTGSISFTKPTAPRGALVFLTRSAKDGTVWQAAALRVAFAAAP